MNIYSVYTDSSNDENSPLLIKQGFSFMAGIFNYLWALYHRMWFLALTTLAINLMISNFASSHLAYSINIVILLLFGFFSTELREYHAMQNGLELSDVILAQNEEEAESKYYMRTNS
ncbi:MAG: DUF2628 domain-containing protein [Rickettsiaceae bacterium]|nr:DUF2628 domain-containing protein [Rickettsiaceae bacterium]